MSRVFILISFTFSFLVLPLFAPSVRASVDSYNLATSKENCPLIQVVNGDPNTGDLVEGRAPLVSATGDLWGRKLPEDQRRIQFFILVKSMGSDVTYDIVFDEGSLTSWSKIAVLNAKPVEQSNDYGTGQKVALLLKDGLYVSLLVDTASYAANTLFSSGNPPGKRHYFYITRKVKGQQVGDKYCEGYYNIIKDSSQNVNTCTVEFDPKSLNENSPVKITGGLILPYNEPLSLYPGYRLHIKGSGGFDRTYSLSQNKDGSLLAKDLDPLPAGEYTRYLQKGQPGATENPSYIYTDIPICFGNLSIASEKEVTEGKTGTSTDVSVANGHGGGVNPATGEAVSPSELTGEASRLTGKNCIGKECATSAGRVCYTTDDHTKPDGIETAIGCVPTEPQRLLIAGLRLSASAGGGIALLLMIFGAIRMITSAGNPESVKKGQDQFASAVIGLLFIIFSILLLQIIGVDILNLPGFTR